MKRWLLLFALFLLESNSSAETYTLQLKAHTSNAGGQQVYGVRRGNDTHEISGFYNQFLLSGGKPIWGGTYHWRFPICGIECFWQFYAQAGIGLSTGGPILEFTWSTTAFWVARIDFATQIFVTRTRLVSWSNPLWIGVSVPLPF